MKTLTLDQVRQAERFAYAHIPWTTFHWAPPDCLRILHLWGESTVTENIRDDCTPKLGWHHRSGCDCKFCDGRGMTK